MILFNCTYSPLEFTPQAKAVCSGCAHTTLLGHRTCPLLIQFWKDNGDTATAGIFAKLGLEDIPDILIPYAWIDDDEGLEYVSIDFSSTYRDACISFTSPDESADFISFIQKVKDFEVEWDARPHCALRELPVTQSLQ